MDAMPELLETIQDGIATLTFNRPERMNALSTPIMEGLLHGLPRLAGDPAVKVVVLTGAGRAFCAGQDLADPAVAPDLTPGAKPTDVGNVIDRFYKPLALRLPVIVFGTLGVGAIYLLARVLYGWRVAIVAAGLATAFTWHLSFSRIALPAIASLTCDTLAAALLVVGLRRGNRFVLGAAGVAAAAGQYFYFSSELMLVVLALIGLHQLVAGRVELRRRNLAGLLLFMVGFLIAVGPIAQVAASDFGRFNARASTVTIFNEVNQAGNWSPLINNIQAHLLMFNVRGDPNGRHNWSGRPMLDPVTGGLGIAGLAFALLRCWRFEYALPLIWL